MLQALKGLKLILRLLGVHERQTKMSQQDNRAPHDVTKGSFPELCANRARKDSKNKMCSRVSTAMTYSLQKSRSARDPKSPLPMLCHLTRSPTGTPRDMFRRLLSEHSGSNAKRAR